MIFLRQINLGVSQDLIANYNLRRVGIKMPQPQYHAKPSNLARTNLHSLRLQNSINTAQENSMTLGLNSKLCRSMIRRSLAPPLRASGAGAIYLNHRASLLLSLNELTRLIQILIAANRIKGRRQFRKSPEAIEMYDSPQISFNLTSLFRSRRSGFLSEKAFRMLIYGRQLLIPFR